MFDLFALAHDMQSAVLPVDPNNPSHATTPTVMLYEVVNVTGPTVPPR